MKQHPEGSRFQPDFSDRLAQSEKARASQLLTATSRAVTYKSDSVGVDVQLEFRAGKLVSSTTKNHKTETNNPLSNLKGQALEAHLDAVLGPVPVEVTPIKELAPEVTKSRLVALADMIDSGPVRNSLKGKQRVAFGVMAALTITSALASACAPAYDKVSQSNSDNVIQIAEATNLQVFDWESNPQLIKNANKDGSIFNNADPNRLDLNDGYVASLKGKSEARTANNYGIIDPNEGAFNPENGNNLEHLEIATNQDPAYLTKVDAAVEEWKRINPHVEVKVDQNGDKYIEFRGQDGKLIEINDWSNEYWDAFFDNLYKFTPDFTASGGSDDGSNDGGGSASANESNSGAGGLGGISTPPLALGNRFDASNANNFICNDGIRSVEDAINKAQQNACLSQTMQDRGMDVSNLTGKAGTIRELINHSDQLKEKFPLNTTLKMYVKIQVPKTAQNPSGLSRGTIEFMLVEGSAMDLKGPVKILGVENQGFLLSDGNVDALLLKMCGNVIMETPLPKVPDASPTPTSSPTAEPSPSATATNSPTATRQEAPTATPVPIVLPPYSEVQLPGQPEQPIIPPPSRLLPPPPIEACIRDIHRTNLSQQELYDEARRVGYEGHPFDIKAMQQILFDRTCRDLPPPPQLPIEKVCAYGIFYTGDVFQLYHLAYTKFGYRGLLNINEIKAYLDKTCVPSTATNTPVTITTGPSSTPVATITPGGPSLTPTETATATATATESPTAPATVTGTVPTASVTATATETATATATATATETMVVITPTIPSPQPTDSVPTATRGATVTRPGTATPPPTPDIPSPQPTDSVPTATRGATVTRVNTPRLPDTPIIPSQQPATSVPVATRGR